MNKSEFLAALRAKLSGLPNQDVEERLNFYSEMIDDRIEEELSEEDAISKIGSVDAIAEQIVTDIPLSKIAKEKIKPKRRMKVWEIVLLAISSPFWLVLTVAAFIIVLAVYIVIWSVIISLWAIFTSLVACAPCGVVAGIVFAFTGSALPGIAIICAGFVCAGLAILMLFGCKAATKGILMLTKKIALGIKKSFVAKEDT